MLWLWFSWPIERYKPVLRQIVFSHVWSHEKDASLEHERRKGMLLDTDVH